MYWEMLKIDFQGEDAIYIQLRNQIVLAIASSRLHEGDSLPSVRTMAEGLGINMHTVNKAYSLLREEGLLTMDRRRGAVINIDVNHLMALEELDRDLQIILAKSICRNISRNEVHQLVDRIYDAWTDL